mmetsp:Transcript_104111/g.222427  ORF Transcript_104111/g.222427 Transcript_104111/m.222427 type:complete len:636 (+) Transcript_104111:64-1971(+)
MVANFTVDPRDTLVRWSGDGSQDGWKAVTLAEAFAHRSRLHGSLPTLRWKRTKEQREWSTWTMQEYHMQVRRVGKALIAHGFERFDTVNIIAFNAPEWFFAACGAIFAGGITSGIYITNLPPACQYILEHSKCKFAFVDSKEQLDKILAVRSQCPNLRGVVVWGDDAAALSAPPFVRSWEDFMAAADSQGEDALEERIRSQTPGHACLLSYTSGTTGPPKAVMFAHDTVLYGMNRLCHRMFDYVVPAKRTNFEEREVSYNPMSHIAGSSTLFAQLAQSDGMHRCVYFAFPDAMSGSLVETLKDVQPTIFLAVPRIWEKLYDAIKVALKANPEMEGNPEVRSVVGLNAVKVCTTGSAPMQKELFSFFDKLDLEIQEIYGMTENTALCHLNAPGERVVGTVGRPVVPGSVKLDPTSGEILMRSRALMMGYMHNLGKTRETFDEEGWLKTGDIGAVFAGPKAEANMDGYYKIVGRIKELIITAGGENMPPVLIEADLKQQLPMISNVMIVGDMQKMLVALFTLKLKPRASGGWTDELDLESAAFDTSCKTVEQAKASPKWKAALDGAVDAYNKGTATSRAQNVRAYAVLDTDFAPNVELTPTLKLKRDVVQSRYANVIRELYGDTFVETPWSSPPSKL